MTIKNWSFIKWNKEILYYKQFVNSNSIYMNEIVTIIWCLNVNENVDKIFWKKRNFLFHKLNVLINVKNNFETPKKYEKKKKCK